MKKTQVSCVPAQGLKKLAQAIGAITLVVASVNLAAEEGNPRVNQVGYFPNSSKIAVYKTSSTSAQTWQLTRNGSVIASGQTVPQGVDAASGDNLHRIDFTNINTTGEGLVLKVGSDTSYPFKISSTLLSGHFYDALKYFYHNRSGIAIETPYTGGGTYSPDNKWARPAGHLNAGANKGDMNVPCWTGTCNYTLNVTKGWYDAGDHGKYVVNGGISVWTLLNLYERSLYSTRGAASAFKLSDALADSTFTIPESGNGVSDLLDEARWEMEFLMAMQVPAGQAKAGMVHHKVHDVGWTGLPLAPHQDGQDRALVPPSTAATLNVAATGAQCARIWKNIDSAFSAKCLDVAERAWTAAQANPTDIYTSGYDNGGGAYGDMTVTDDFYWAAVELYLTTGDNKYLSTIQNYTITRTDFNWADTELPGLMSLALVPASHSASLRTAAQQKIVSIANAHLATQNASGYLAPLSSREFYWGSNSGITNKLMIVGLAYDFTGNTDYAEGVIKGLDYLLGRNTLSTSFVTATGTKAVAQPHHRFWAGALSANFPWAPPGALSGGPNAGLEDEVSAGRLGGCATRPATCWIDSIDAWSTNEITINWNAPYAWILGFANEYAAGAGQSSSSSSVSSSSIAPSSSSSSSSSIAPSSSSSSLPSSSSSSRISSSSSSSAISSSRSSSSSSVASGNQCNWYGSLYPLCVTTQAGWGWEDNKSCVARTTCASQPAPFGIVGGTSSTAFSSSSRAISSSSAISSSLVSSAISSSLASSSVVSSSSAPRSSSSSSSSVAAGGGNCQYIVNNEWNSGFTASIRITNNGNSAINGWSVSWSYTDGSQMTSNWNANISGSNPYTATNLGWNGTIQPGQSVEFGVQGNKSGSSAQIPVVTGSVCR